LQCFIYFHYAKSFTHVLIEFDTQATSLPQTLQERDCSVSDHCSITEHSCFHGYLIANSWKNLNKY